MEYNGSGARDTRGHKKGGLDDGLSPDSEMNMITFSEGQLYRQPWVDPDGTAVTDEKIASGPVSGYRGSFFLGEVSWAFVRSEVWSSAGSCGGAGCGACGRRWRGRSGLWRWVSEGIVAIVRRLGEGRVDRRVGQWWSELIYRLWGNDSCSKWRTVLVSRLLACISEISPGGCSLLSGSG